jgi:rare lipoprotein A
MNLRKPAAGTAAWRFLAAVCTGCAIVPVVCAAPSWHVQKGVASVYSKNLNGKPTASGELYDSGALTAAHRALPLGAQVKVTNVENGKSVQVRVNDRGPQLHDRIIDLSSAAARALGIRSGTARVKLEIVSEPSSTQSKSTSRR